MCLLLFLQELANLMISHRIRSISFSSIFFSTASRRTSKGSNILFPAHRRMKVMGFTFIFDTSKKSDAAATIRAICPPSILNPSTAFPPFFHQKRPLMRSILKPVKPQNRHHHSPEKAGKRYNPEQMPDMNHHRITPYNVLNHASKNVEKYSCAAVFG